MLLSSTLLGAVVLYDWVHKQTRFAPVLMAACRFLLYLVAASAGGGPANRAVLWRAVAMAAYVVGLSYLARGESKATPSMGWTVGLLFVPVATAFLQPGSAFATVLAFAVVQALWTLCCLLRLVSAIPSGVPGLLAGIALVDGLAAVGHGLTAVFLALFVLALCLQRLAPAT